MWFISEFIKCVLGLQTLMETYQEFVKLEKVEVGGVAGKPLSAMVQEIYTDFLENYKVFSEGKFDCLDTSDSVSTHYCLNVK